MAEREVVKVETVERLVERLAGYHANHQKAFQRKQEIFREHQRRPRFTAEEAVELQEVELDVENSLRLIRGVESRFAEILPFNVIVVVGDRTVILNRTEDAHGVHVMVGKK